MKEKITKILILILIIILIYMIVDINASYKTMLGENIDSTVEPWVIFVNDENIATSETKTFEINELMLENPNVSNGKLAPGSIIGLPIKIDATETKNMDIRYDIIIDDFEITHPNLKIGDVIGKDSDFDIVKTGKNTYTGIITKENIENDVIHELVVNVIWENDEDSNDIDTALGTSEERMLLDIPLTVRVAQYGNEEIVEYKEEKIQ